MQLAGRCADGVILGTGFDLRVYRLGETKDPRRRSTKPDARKAKSRVIAAGMLCVRDDGNEARKIVRNRIANRAHHNFRFTYETVPPEELDGVKKFVAGFDVMKPMEDRVDPDLVNDYLVQRFSIAGTPKGMHRENRRAKSRRRRTSDAHPGAQSLHESVEAFAKNVIPHFRD